MALVIVCVYLVLTIAIGVVSKRRASSSGSYHGEGLPLLFCIAIGAGEWMGGTSTTGVAEYGYIYGLSGAWYTIANGIGIAFCGLCFARLYRSLKTSTVSAIIGKYYKSDKVRAVASICLIVCMIAVGASQVVSLGVLGNYVFGVDVKLAIVLIGIAVTVYTMLGGMNAVGNTNYLHLIMLYVGVVASLLWLVFSKADLVELRASLPDESFSFGTIGWSRISSWLVASILGACTAQAGIQPILVAKDESTAVKSSLWIAVLVAPFGILTALLGMYSRYFYPEIGSAKEALVSIVPLLPDVLGGSLLAGLLAAVLSTAAPIFLSSSTLFTRDIYCNIIKKNAGEAEVLRISRGATITAGVVCILLALAFYDSTAILDIVYFAYSIRGSIFIVLLLGIYWHKSSPRGAAFGLCGTLIVGLFWVVYNRVFGSYPIASWFSETYAAMLSALLFTYLGSITEKRNRL